MKSLQSVEPLAQADGDVDQRAERLRTGDQLPARLTPADMMAIFNIKVSRFYELVQQGRFDRFEIRPRIGRRAWSGRLVMAYLNGEAHSSRFTVATRKG